MTTQPMTPEEFAEKVRTLTQYDDPESAHINTDILMERVLESLGYGEGIKLLRESTRWYA